MSSLERTPRQPNQSFSPQSDAPGVMSSSPNYDLPSQGLCQVASSSRIHLTFGRVGRRPATAHSPQTPAEFCQLLTEIIGDLSSGIELAQPARDLLIQTSKSLTGASHEGLESWVDYVKQFRDNGLSNAITPMVLLAGTEIMEAYINGAAYPNGQAVMGAVLGFTMNNIEKFNSPRLNDLSIQFLSWETHGLDVQDRREEQRETATEAPPPQSPQPWHPPSFVNPADISGPFDDCTEFQSSSVPHLNSQPLKKQLSSEGAGPKLGAFNKRKRAENDATDMRNKKAKGREASSPVEAGNTGTMGPPPKPVDLSRARFEKRTSIPSPPSTSPSFLDLPPQQSYSVYSSTAPISQQETPTFSSTSRQHTPYPQTPSQQQRWRLMTTKPLAPLQTSPVPDDGQQYSMYHYHVLSKSASPAEASSTSPSFPESSWSFQGTVATPNFQTDMTIPSPSYQPTFPGLTAPPPSPQILFPPPPTDPSLLPAPTPMNPGAIIVDHGPFISSEGQLRGPLPCPQPQRIDRPLTQAGVDIVLEMINHNPGLYVANTYGPQHAATFSYWHGANVAGWAPGG